MVVASDVVVVVVVVELEDEEDEAVGGLVVLDDSPVVGLSLLSLVDVSGSGYKLISKNSRRNMRVL